MYCRLLISSNLAAWSHNTKRASAVPAKCLIISGRCLRGDWQNNFRKLYVHLVRRVVDYNCCWPQPLQIIIQMRSRIDLAGHKEYLLTAFNYTDSQIARMMWSSQSSFRVRMLINISIGWISAFNIVFNSWRDCGRDAGRRSCLHL